VAIIYITQCAENIIIHNIIQICTLFDLYIINVQHFLQTYNKDVLLFGHAPEPIEEDKTWRLVGVNTNGI
jgi:hypothetical protein